MSGSDGLPAWHSSACKKAKARQSNPGWLWYLLQDEDRNKRAVNVVPTWTELNRAWARTGKLVQRSAARLPGELLCVPCAPWLLLPTRYQAAL